MKSSTYHHHSTPDAAVMRVYEDGKMRVEQNGLVMMEISNLGSLNYHSDFDGIRIEASVFGDPVEGIIEAVALRDVLMPHGLVRVEKVIIEDPFQSGLRYRY